MRQREGTTMSRRLNELKKTALSMMAEEHGDLPEKIVDNMIEIVRSKMESEKDSKRRAVKRRLEEMARQAERQVDRRYSAKIDTLEVIKIHMKKEEYEQASTLLRGFYLARKPRPTRKARPPAAELEAPPREVEEAVKEVLEERVPEGTLQQLAGLMSISEEEARMYSLELAAGFEKSTRHKITPEKAAECYLRFRNWDFRRTWLPSIRQGSASS